MKALTLTQPWATLVAIRAKRIETRSWTTSYRGPLAIHAAKGFPRSARDFHYAMVAQQFDLTIEALPLGAVIATCRLISCLPTREIPESRHLIEVDPVANAEDFRVTEQERCLGDYTPGRWAWLLADLKSLPEPIPAKGALGLWEWRP